MNQMATQFHKLIDRNKLGFDLYPFKIYVLPLTFRRTLNSNDTYWRTVRVRGGYVFTSTVSTSSYVQGCDGFETYAYANTYNIHTASADILLPTSQSLNPIWFWIENSGSATPPSYILRYGSNPTGSSTGNPSPSWTSFPTADSTHIPIGLVDAYTSSSIKQLLIRQYVNSDIISTGGGGGWNWKGTYAESSSYAVNDVVFVDFNKTYSVPFTVDSSSRFPALCAGIFLNTTAVPSIASGSISSSRNTLNYYYPMNPTIPSSSMVMVSGSLANQTFWQPINPLVQMSVCVGGSSTKTYWMDAWTTDTFNLAQLPYTGSH